MFLDWYSIPNVSGSWSMERRVCECKIWRLESPIKITLSVFKASWIGFLNARREVLIAEVLYPGSSGLLSTVHVIVSNRSLGEARSHDDVELPRCLKRKIRRNALLKTIGGGSLSIPETRTVIAFLQDVYHLPCDQTCLCLWIFKPWQTTFHVDSGMRAVQVFAGFACRSIRVVQNWHAKALLWVRFLFNDEAHMWTHPVVTFDCMQSSQLCTLLHDSTVFRSEIRSHTPGNFELTRPTDCHSLPSVLPKATNWACRLDWSGWSSFAGTWFDCSGWPEDQLLYEEFEPSSQKNESNGPVRTSPM